MRAKSFKLSSEAALCLLLLLLLLWLVSQQCQAQTFQSAEQAVPLIELFTSEGCSSCPPADRWMKGLRQSEHLWDKFVPLAFHVDYWDYIGWKDPFASREYSQRQRRYASEFGESTVYTPGMRIAGEQWRNWYQSEAPDQLKSEKVGRLTFEVTNNTQFLASFSQSNDSMQLNIAVLGLDMSSHVKRGENRGKTLQHDFRCPRNLSPLQR